MIKSGTLLQERTLKRKQMLNHPLYNQTISIYLVKYLFDFPYPYLSISLDGVVRIVIDLPEEHQFSASIKEEAKERIEHLWDVKEVKIEFVN
ncbi:hypothetical protein JT05_11255 [Desulfosporosinus sp. Tol-M]|nr:hypothetical protein JT05_11255 [Desulfosporosinus sp. Tol-M]